MFEDFILNAISDSSKQLFICEKPSKIKQIKRALIYTGHWCGVMSSYPVKNLPLDDYTELTIELSDGQHSLMSVDYLDIDKQLKDKIIKYQYCGSQYCDFQSVPDSLIKELIIQLYDVKANDIAQKYGGKCRKCGDYDDYAPIDSCDGKCFCYKCFR